jgi:phospholipase/lecithinase/hemolysin
MPLQVFDVYSISLASYNSPPFGIRDVTHSCLTNYQKLGRDPNTIVCDSPSTHLFWDDQHLVTQAHTVFAWGIAA